MFKRIDLYLQQGLGESYQNTSKEQELVEKFSALYSMAKSEHDNQEQCNPKKLEKYRKAYKGTLNALKSTGEESSRKSRHLRKMVYELVESKIDNNIPMPKMQARYKTDLPLISITEQYLKFEVDRALTKYENDRSERCTYVDGTGWYKIGWDSLNNTHERSGDVTVEFRTIDQIVPQPGVNNYKQLEYIFERSEVSATRLYDMYNRLITPTKDNNIVDVVSCYYLNEERVVGLFMWSPSTLQVICNEESWQIRKLRTCQLCGTINPTGKHCRMCNSTNLKFKNAETEILDEDLEEIYNPYEVGETTDENERDHYKSRVFISRGTEIPFYKVNQLPFVPRPAVSSMDSLYGISESEIVIDMQDGINKVLTKAVDKTLKSGAVVTKPEKVKMSDTDDTFKVLGVRNAEEAQMVQAKQIVADTSQDIMIASLLYESGKASSGVTDSFQGKRDTTATSGKAKEYAALQSAGRIESLRVMKSAAFAGIYELVLKYLLAFSDESRKFVRSLPDGTEVEQTWNKYMFLSKDKYGTIYYRDDFQFSTDAASTLSQNRVQMWQETTDKFVQGAFGNPSDPKVLKLYWNTMDSLQYPLAKIALAGIAEGEKHLPYEIEQAIMNNPQLLQAIMQMLQTGSGSGGARPNSGPAGNGATHAANVERTNERNRAANKETPIVPQAQGGVS